MKTMEGFINSQTRTSGTLEPAGLDLDPVESFGFNKQAGYLNRK
jgi:hypothetical protein